MAKFIQVQNKRVRLQYPRRFQIVCENYPECGAHADPGNHWTPHPSINVHDPKILAAEMARQAHLFLHHCAKCHAGILASQPPGQRGEILQDFIQKVERANAMILPRRF